MIDCLDWNVECNEETHKIPSCTVVLQSSDSQGFVGHELRFKRVGVSMDLP